jgi:hypothetical protein
VNVNTSTLDWKPT